MGPSSRQRARYCGRVHFRGADGACATLVAVHDAPANVVGPVDDREAMRDLEVCGVVNSLRCRRGTPQDRTLGQIVWVDSHGRTVMRIAKALKEGLGLTRPQVDGAVGVVFLAHYDLATRVHSERDRRTTLLRSHSTFKLTTSEISCPPTSQLLRLIECSRQLVHEEGR